MARNHKEYVKAWGQRQKLECITEYGGACKCCGEDRLVFLVIDHIYGGGHKEQSVVGHGHQFYRWLKKQGYPKDRYQVLCHNCNFAKRMGVCPHHVGK